MNPERKPLYADLHDLSEDDRIKLIAETVLSAGMVTGFLVENDKKADRYIEKLRKRFPGVDILGKMRGPTKGIILVKVGPASAKN